MTTRRTLLLGGAAVAVAAAGAGAYAIFGTGSPSGPSTSGPVADGDAVTSVRPSPNASVNIDALHEPGPLGEVALGADDAPVVIVEYASLTCGHCANFHNHTYPTLKTNYIDTGRARLLFREFPLDPIATAAAMIARCMPEDRFFAFVDVLFQQQRAWAYSDSPLEEIGKISRQIGFSQQDLDACLQNQSVLDGVNAVKNRASSEFAVQSTPTFFINGELLRGARPIDEFDTRIEALLTA
ncbi:MAG: DsbA family protein [Pseudomonadota bacterium]